MARNARPRKALGVLESTALFLIATRAYAELDTSAADLLAEFARFDARDVSPSGLYLLLETLERKNLVEHAMQHNVDALGRLRQVRYYRITDRGKQLAKAEYHAQSSIIEAARPALTATAAGATIE